MKKLILMAFIFVLTLSACSKPQVIVEANVSLKHMKTESLVHKSENNVIDSVINIDLDNFIEEITLIFDNADSYLNREVCIKGYFIKMLDDKLYYFIANDLCLGCENEDMYGQFIEVLNTDEIELDTVFSDDFIELSGIIKVMTNSEGYKYPVIDLKTIEKIN